MTNARTPLLADPRRSGESDRSDRLAEEEDGALGNRSSPSPSSRHGSFWSTSLREIFLFIWALLATAAVIVLTAWMQHRQQTSHPSSDDPPAREAKKNLIFMVSDGMGPASLSLTRSFRQHVEGLPIDETLTLDRHFWGTSRTRSTNSLVTDSAAGATAFSCGQKSYNGAISVLPSNKPCGTVLEAAKRAGYATGLVVTTDVTDATPACFASHVDYRWRNDQIALQEVGEGVLGRVVDLMFGGGRCHFLPNGTEGSCRADGEDVARIARERHGWSYFDSREGFDSLKGGEDVPLPALGLFAPADIPFEIDRRNAADVYPSLSEMATTALRALEKATEGSDKGFFLMIEGSRIDHAGHINDPAAQVHEVLEYDRAFKAVLNFIDQSPDEGVLVATSDHETGGLSTALQELGHLPVYNWYPEALRRASASAEHLNNRLREHLESLSSSSSSSSSAVAADELKQWINETLVYRGLGIANAREAELDQLISPPADALVVFADMISLRAHVGWSTHGHTAVDVNVYSSGGPGTDEIRGNVENTDVGKFLAKYLSLDLEPITKELREKMDMGAIASASLGSPMRAYDDEGADVKMEGLPLNWVSGHHTY